MSGAATVLEIRVALTVDDFQQAIAFYRDALGLPVDKEWKSSEGNGVVFAVGRGTLEVVDVPEAESIDLVEVGGVVGERVRLGMRVDGVDSMHEGLAALGVEMLGGPVSTPWGGRNARVRTPDGMQLTLFEERHTGA